MSVGLATKGVIGGGFGLGVSVPVCEPDPGTSEFASIDGLSISAVDPDAIPPQPAAGEELLPRRLSTVQILPTKTIDNFSSPGNL